MWLIYYTEVLLFRNIIPPDDIRVCPPSLARDSKFLRCVNRGCCICRHSRRAVSTLSVCGNGSLQNFSICWIQRAVCRVACSPERLRLEDVSYGLLNWHLGTSPFSVDLRKWKELFVNGFECTNPIPVEMEFLNS